MTDGESEDADQQSGGDFDDALGNALSGRVGKRPQETDDEAGDEGERGETGNTGDTGSTSSTSSKGETISTEKTRGPDPDPNSTRRTRTKYAVYLTEEFQEELNQAYTKANAQRVMEDKGEIEKHKHFLEAVMRAGLNHDDLDAYIEELLERY
jgi:murein L,D-transpeptidase YcbB/YkuD